MILPHPETNLKTNIIVLGSDIIDIMTKNPYKGKYVVVDEVMSRFLKGDDNRTPDLFLYTLSFLYLIGSIEKKGYKIRLLKREANESQKSLFE